MSNITTMDLIQESIKKVIEDKVKIEIENTIKEACDKIIRGIREQTGAIVSRVASHFDYMKDQNRIIITVNFKDDK